MLVERAAWGCHNQSGVGVSGSGCLIRLFVTRQQLALHTRKILLSCCLSFLIFTKEFCFLVHAGAAPIRMLGEIHLIWAKFT